MCAVGLLPSCNRDTVAPTQKETPIDFKSIGVNHNKGLDYVFNYIKANRGTGKVSLQQMVKLNKAASIEYIIKTYPNLSGSERQQVMSKMQSINEAFTSRVSGRTLDATQDLLDQIAPNMTATQKYHINNIFSSVVNLDYDINAVQASLNIIESQAYAMPYEEGAIVLAAVSVARNSSNYWNENLNSWVEEVNGGGPIPSGL